MDQTERIQVRGFRTTDSCFTQLKAQGPSQNWNEGNEDEEDNLRLRISDLATVGRAGSDPGGLRHFHQESTLLTKLSIRAICDANRVTVSSRFGRFNPLYASPSPTF